MSQLTRSTYRSLLLFTAFLTGVLSILAFGDSDEGTISSPHYPVGIVRTVDNHFLVANKGVKTVELYTEKFDVPIYTWSFAESPTGVTAFEDFAYVTTFETSGKVYFVNLKTRKIEKEVLTGSGATYPLVSPDGQTLYILNQFQNTISKIDIKSAIKIADVRVLRQPFCAVVDQHGKYLFTANHLPAQRADVDTVAACVSVIDLKNFRKIKDIQLANGSNAIRGICLSPDGQYVFITHNLGRFQVPTNQLQQGWMNTSAMTIIDAANWERLGTVLLDEPERGAAGIWGIQCTNEKILITHSGTHEVSVIDYPEFIDKFIPYPDKSSLEYDLRFFYGLRKRIPLAGNGPRNFIINSDIAYIPTYYADTLNILHLADLENQAVPLVRNRVESEIDKGEKYFNDAAYCFQNWQSCNGCHPDDARTDGMNWDLLNDGLGNPKNCKSMLYSHVTPPCMISGIRAMAEVAVRKGFNLIQFYDIPEEKAQCVDEYLKSLRPVPSPYLVDGKLSEKAQRGKKIFEKLDCASCHTGIYFTDQKMYRIGQDVEFENGWDTPTLLETWRTAPYLFDGRAATMEDVFEVHKHGIEKKVSKKEIEELVEYVNSL